MTAGSRTAEEYRNMSHSGKGIWNSVFTAKRLLVQKKTTPKDDLLLSP